MCWRIIGPASMSRLRIPGVCSSRRSIASATVAASTSVERWVPGISDTRERGRITVAIGGASVESHGLDAPDRRQVLGEAGPTLALVGRSIQLARARPEEDPYRIEPIDRQRLAVHTDECVLLREAVAVGLPAVGPLACPPDSKRPAPPVVPPSSGATVAPARIPTHTLPASEGWGTIVWHMRPPAPGRQRGRLGCSRRPATWLQLAPPSSLRNSPAGSTPAKMAP